MRAVGTNTVPRPAWPTLTRSFAFASQLWPQVDGLWGSLPGSQVSVRERRRVSSSPPSRLSSGLAVPASGGSSSMTGSTGGGSFGVGGASAGCEGGKVLHSSPDCASDEAAARRTAAKNVRSM